MKTSVRTIESAGSEASGELAYHALVPDQAVRAGRASLVVAVHGISRNALEQVASFSSLAGARGHVLMAPCFDTPEDEDYQRLGRRGRGRRADLALDDAICRLGEKANIEFGHRFYFGYSGGGQFVHRYLMSHPNRVTAAVVAAAGWYTFPDARQAYPHGLRVGAVLAGVRMEPIDFLRVPVRVMIGALDVDRDQSVRTTTKVDESQGKDRIERARRWVAEMQAAARSRSLPGRHELTILDGAGHSFSDCVEAGLAVSTFDFFDSVESSAPGAARSIQNLK
jgi:pimeloyl-ACP methyl ester carboxylesterase